MRDLSEYIERALRKEHHNVLSFREAVPCAETAIHIALAVWLPVYGGRRLAGQEPFEAIRHGEFWFVCGTLPPRWLGGVAEALIRASNGEVLNVSHGR